MGIIVLRFLIKSGGGNRPSEAQQRSASSMLIPIRSNILADK